MICLVRLAVLTLLIVSMAACITKSGPRHEHAAYDRQCEEMAWFYRRGQPEKLCFYDMKPYFDLRIGEMTKPELLALLGPGLDVAPGFGYYDYALNSTPDWVRGEQFDEVLLYSENGPPDHWIPDASFNLFFILKDERVVAIRPLFP